MYHVITQLKYLIFNPILLQTPGLNPGIMIFIKKGVCSFLYYIHFIKK